MQGRIQDLGQGGGGGVWVTVNYQNVVLSSDIFRPLYEVWGSLKGNPLGSAPVMSTETDNVGPECQVHVDMTIN